MRWQLRLLGCLMPPFFACFDADFCDGDEPACNGNNDSFMGLSVPLLVPVGSECIDLNALHDSRLGKQSGDMSDLFWLTNTQMSKLSPFFPKSRGKPRVGDKRVLSGIIFINRDGLRWCDAQSACGPHKRLYSSWKRWSEKGIFARMMAGLREYLPLGRRTRRYSAFLVGSSEPDCSQLI